MSRLSWVLALHIAFLAIWSASLVYMPQLFARQLAAADAARERLVLMQRWLYAKIMTPAALLTVLAGIWLIFERGFAGGWMPVKLALVLGMGVFHAYCGYLMVGLKRVDGRHGSAFYRLLPLLPLIFTIAIVWLVSAKPF